jgi:Tfp pilus assembly protein PilE
MNAPSHSRGLSVVELVVAAAIIVSVVTMATSAWQLYFRVSRTNGQLTQATLLTEEASEAINFLRDLGWTTYVAPLSLDIPYYIYWNGTQYTISSTPITVNKIYNVTVTLSAVNRDVNSNITTSGGTLDARTKAVKISIINATSSQTVLEVPLIIHDVFHN